MDCLHLAMAYEASHGEKRSEGSVFLRQILSKFYATTGDIDDREFFTGVEDVRALAAERTMTQHVEDGSMSSRTANQIKDNIDVKRRFSNRREFAQHIAALVKIYTGEMSWKYQGRTVREMLHSACKPERTGWFLNHTNQIK